MGIIKGQTIKLTVRTKTGVDDLGASVYSEVEEDVSNVVIEAVSSDAVTSEFMVTGKRLAYVLHIPKDDTHEWTNTTVQFYGKTFKTYGEVLEYDKTFTPLDWNKKVKVECYG